MQIHVILQVQLEVALQHLRRSQAAAAQAARASEWHSAGRAAVTVPVSGLQPESTSSTPSSSSSAALAP